MRYLFTAILLSLTVVSANVLAQANAGFGSNYVGNTNTLLLNTPDAHPNVEGSPYVPAAKFMPGWLVQGNQTFRQNLRFNALTGQVEFMHDNKLHGVAQAISVVGIIASPSDTLRFERGYASVGTRTPNDFYQILYGGNRVRLLRAIRATIKKNGDQMSSDFGKQSFNLNEDYYIWYAASPTPARTRISPYDGTLTPVVSSRKSITAALPQESSRIDQYAADKKVKLKNWEEIVGLLKAIDKW
jgi:hypothetical protein